jgi:hypothetical protein
MIAHLYLQNDNTLDVMSVSSLPTDHDLFFGPINEGAKPYFTNSKNIGEILFALGLVVSKNWCRKNNWWRELEPGYQEIVFGSKRVKLCILITS